MLSSIRRSRYRMLMQGTSIHARYEPSPPVEVGSTRRLRGITLDAARRGRDDERNQISFAVAGAKSRLRPVSLAPVALRDPDDPIFK